MVEQSMETLTAPRSGWRVRTELLGIAAKAKAEAGLKFTTLYHLMNEEMLRESFNEQDFIEGSYGFRVRRSRHDALRALMRAVEREGTNLIVEAEILGFFDNVVRAKMLEYQERRIADKRMLRMVMRYLRAGVKEDGEWRASEKGTPQGGEHLGNAGKYLPALRPG